jgi:hypothetical protein
MTSVVAGGRARKLDTVQILVAISDLGDSYTKEGRDSYGASWLRLNRAKPIEIATPALRNLQISGVFATDDTEAFIAFLRSLKGVRVEVMETRIRVS